jgi:hypothetical protein
LLPPNGRDGSVPRYQPPDPAPADLAPPLTRVKSISVYSYLTLPLSYVFDHFIFDEKITLSTVLGSPITIAAILISNSNSNFDALHYGAA